MGKGVMKAVENIKTIIVRALTRDARDARRAPPLRTPLPPLAARPLAGAGPHRDGPERSAGHR